MAGPLGHRGNEGDRGRAAADHHDLLAVVVEVLRPELRVHERAREAVGARELRHEAVVVAEVAAAQVEEVGGVLDRLGLVAGTNLQVQRASSEDQEARTTRWRKRMWRSIPCSAAVSRM